MLYTRAFTFALTLGTSSGDRARVGSISLSPRKASTSTAQTESWITSVDLFKSNLSKCHHGELETRRQHDQQEQSRCRSKLHEHDEPLGKDPLEQLHVLQHHRLVDTRLRDRTCGTTDTPESKEDGSNDSDCSSSELGSFCMLDDSESEHWSDDEFTPGFKSREDWSIADGKRVWDLFRLGKRTDTLTKNEILSVMRAQTIPSRGNKYRTNARA